MKKQEAHAMGAGDSSIRDTQQSMQERAWRYIERTSPRQGGLVSFSLDLRILFWIGKIEKTQMERYLKDLNQTSKRRKTKVPANVFC